MKARRVDTIVVHYIDWQERAIHQPWWVAEYDVKITKKWGWHDIKKSLLPVREYYPVQYKQLPWISKPLPFKVWFWDDYLVFDKLEKAKRYIANKVEISNMNKL